MSHAIQSRLLALAGVFVALYSLALTVSPVARARSLEAPLRWEHWLGTLVWLASFALAHRESKRRLPEHDPYLLPLAGLLSGWGLLTIYRLEPAFGLRQTLWLALSVGVFTLGLRWPARLEFLRRFKYLWLTGGLLLTALTLFFGANPLGYGPRLWLGCCGVYLQPSEPLKLLLIVYLSAYLAGRPATGDGRSQKDRRLSLSAHVPLPTTHYPQSTIHFLAPTLIMTGLALGLLLAQRDMGAASIFLAIYAAVVYAASGRKAVIVSAALTLLAAGLAGYALFDVVRVRMDAWFNPWLDPSGRSYQIVQSLIAVANGGLFGRGPGMGSPSLVPVAHSDFIFTAIAEESGLLGALALAGLLGLLIARGAAAALSAPDSFRRSLAFGLTTYLAAQSILIIGGNIRLLPLTGVTLPFVSYGGSSLLVAFIALLLILQAGRPAETHAPPADPRPILHTASALLLGAAAFAAAAGWWAFARGPDLLTRTDNPRRALADRAVRRGALLDRNDAPIAETSGLPGALSRVVHQPALGAIIGYTHPIYGQSGLEASLDPYLRGLQGVPGLAVWWNHLLYGAPPAGLDVRLTLDLELQRQADALLSGHSGALVALNAASGEILAMSSQPALNANTLDADWAALMSDARAPLLNRATQGLYPAGAGVGPLILAAFPAPDDMPAPPAALLDGCALAPDGEDWAAAVSAGCSGVTRLLAAQLSFPASELLESLGFGQTPQIRLPGANAPLPADIASLQASPLQMALAAAALSAGGNIPAPALAMAVNTPQAGWVMLPTLDLPRQALQPGSAQAAARALAAANGLWWQSVAVENNGDHGPVTWFLGGALPDWPGAPIVVVILLEEDNPVLAVEIGQAVMDAGSR